MVSMPLMPVEKKRSTIFRRARVVKALPQTGKVKSIPRDAGRGAKLPGKRVSKTGNVYWETRINRSDQFGQRV